MLELGFEFADLADPRAELCIRWLTVGQGAKGPQAGQVRQL